MQREVVVVGETLVDVVADGGRTIELPGGSAANAALALARLGVPVSLATSWGSDERGEELADHVRVERIDLLGDPVLGERTSTARATVGEDGAARYDFDVSWDLPAFDLGARPSVLMLTSMAPVVEPGAEKVQSLLNEWTDHTRVVYDLNVRPAITGTGSSVRESVERAVSRSHLVKASDEDLRALWPEMGLVAAAHRLLRLGAQVLVVTRGRSGAMWIESGRLVAEQAVLPAQVADTIGAGDTFGAALVAWLIEHVGPDQEWRGLPESQVRAALAWAAQAAAVTVSRPGADPPTRAEVDSLVGTG